MTSDDELLRLENQLCFAMVTAARNVVAVYRPILEPLGLTHPQYLVMLALWERSPRSLTDLSAELALEPASASPLVKRLEKDGLVERARSTADERRLDITLTDAGRALRARAVEVPHAVMAAVGTGIEEVASLRDALKPFAGRDARSPSADAEPSVGGRSYT
ncbi:MarR family transcriptional regulator [Microbacterium sp.]|uniref:MarR family winged helix-turn-helix transcriptional regulator n=1 Tax=Microbacterium sp. TaxID=51671 RepID=UPI0028A81627|nr:MarR family transcriptional regulator [Microbacterium sp.]